MSNTIITLDLKIFCINKNKKICSWIIYNNIKDKNNTNIIMFPCNDGNKLKMAKKIKISQYFVIGQVCKFKRWKLDAWTLTFLIGILGQK